MTKQSWMCGNDKAELGVRNDKVEVDVRNDKAELDVRDVGNRDGCAE